MRKWSKMRMEAQRGARSSVGGAVCVSLRTLKYIVPEGYGTMGGYASF